MTAGAGDQGQAVAVAPIDKQGAGVGWRPADKRPQLPGSVAEPPHDGTYIIYTLYTHICYTALGLSLRMAHVTVIILLDGGNLLISYPALKRTFNFTFQYTVTVAVTFTILLLLRIYYYYQ